MHAKPGVEINFSGTELMLGVQCQSTMQAQSNLTKMRLQYQSCQFFEFKISLNLA